MLECRLCILGNREAHQYIISDGLTTNFVNGRELFLEHLSFLIDQHQMLNVITNLSEDYIGSLLEIENISIPTIVNSIKLSSPEFSIWLQIAGVEQDFEEIIAEVNSTDNHPLFEVFSRYQACKQKAENLLSCSNNLESEILDLASDRFTRLYPLGERQDTLVFCQRFFGLHFPSILSGTLLPVGSPTKEPKLLRFLRTKLASKLDKLKAPGFVKVVVKKTIPLIDVPKGHSCWMSFNQLRAFIRAFDESHFDLIEVQVFNEHVALDDGFTTEMANWLSVSFGAAMNEVFTDDSRRDWLRTFILCEEKAFWVNLITDINARFDITVSGYGAGAFSFYCWHGELDKICDFIRRRAAVLKHWDKEVEANILEFIEGLNCDDYCFNATENGSLMTAGIGG